MLVGGQPERSDQGEVIGWYGACTDIEEIVQARALMQRSHDEQEALVGQPTAERNSLGTLVQRTDASQLVKGVTRPAKDERPLGQAQEALLQAQKLEAIGQLTAGVAHDFNNLLMPILGALDMLARRGLGGEREQRVINGALEAAERARTLIQRLMTFARPQLPRAAPIDLNGLVGDAANLIEGSATFVSSATLRSNGTRTRQLQAASRTRRPSVSCRRPAGMAAAWSQRKSPENAMCSQPTGEVWARRSSGAGSPAARR